MRHLDAYLARVGCPAPERADLASLGALHRAHAGAVPFENLDLQMGLPVLLDLDHLEDKLVARRRGGYCFEQNTLFLDALRELGYEAFACEARVRQGAPAGTIRPRTHMCLVATVGGERWLADVGFGGNGPLEPVPLDGGEQAQALGRFRVVREGGLHVLRSAGSAGGDWEDLYAFEASPRPAIDFEVANWFTSTHPRSPFVTTLTAQRPIGAERHVLRNLTYSVSAASGPAGGRSREVPRSELLALLHEVFGLDLPAGTRFRSLDGPP